MESQAHKLPCSFLTLSSLPSHFFITSYFFLTPHFYLHNLSYLSSLLLLPLGQPSTFCKQRQVQGQSPNVAPDPPLSPTFLPRWSTMHTDSFPLTIAYAVNIHKTHDISRRGGAGYKICALDVFTPRGYHGLDLSFHDTIIFDNDGTETTSVSDRGQTVGRKPISLYTSKKRRNIARHTYIEPTTGIPERPCCRKRVFDGHCNYTS
jgi:hypothetical protein